MDNEEKIIKKVVLVSPSEEKTKLDEFLQVLVDVAKEMGILATISNGR